MSKLRNIYLVRHGQSTANVNKAVHYELPDHAIPLSNLGIRQATAAGLALSTIINPKHIEPGKLRIWTSPVSYTHLRAHET